MIFRKKKPKRLYIPTKKKWYRRKRKNRTPIRRKRKNNSVKFADIYDKYIKNSLHYVIGAIVILILVLFLLFSTYFSISSIQVSRENLNINSAAIENELNVYIGKNLIFFPADRIVQTIHKKFPEFEKVHVSKRLPSSIIIELESYPIVANMRAYYTLPKAEAPVQETSALNKAIAELGGKNDVSKKPKNDFFNPLDNSLITDSVFKVDGSKETDQTFELGPKTVEQKSLLNRIGQAIFDQENNLELFTISIRGLTQPVEDRQIVITKEHMDYLLSAKDYLTSSMGIEVTGVEYLPIAREIHLKTPSMTLWLNMERSYKTQIDKLASIYQAAELNKEDLSYIDLRVREKVIYCKKKSACAR